MRAFGDRASYDSSSPSFFQSSESRRLSLNDWMDEEGLRVGPMEKGQEVWGRTRVWLSLRFSVVWACKAHAGAPSKVRTKHMSFGSQLWYSVAS
jgi:hypothetical protein